MKCDSDSPAQEGPYLQDGVESENVDDRRLAWRKRLKYSKRLGLRHGTPARSGRGRDGKML